MSMKFRVGDVVFFRHPESGIMIREVRAIEGSCYKSTMLFNSTCFGQQDGQGDFWVESQVDVQGIILWNNNDDE
jgi:hypothetical protein